VGGYGFTQFRRSQSVGQATAGLLTLATIAFGVGNALATNGAKAPGDGVYVVNKDGSGERRVALTDTPGFSWSPDGASVVLAIEREGTKGADLFIAPTSGGALRRVTRTPLIGEGFPAWSPDGSLIAYEGVNEAIEAVRYRIWVVQPNGGNRKRLSPFDDFSEVRPTWAPNGNRMAFLHDISAAHYNVYSMAADGSSRSRLTRTPREEEYFCEWSPNGTQIAFRRSVNSFDLSNTTYDLWVMQANGDHKRRLARNVSNAAPVWSPDGTKLAYVAREWIYLLDLATGASTRLPGSFGAREVAWSPDGLQFAVTLERSGKTDLYLIPAPGAGGSTARLTNDTAIEALPAWSPDGSTIGFARNEFW
jgi:Tol biopolymer transport system component